MEMHLESSIEQPALETGGGRQDCVSEATTSKALTRPQSSISSTLLSPSASVPPGFLDAPLLATQPWLFPSLTMSLLCRLQIDEREGDEVCGDSKQVFFVDGTESATRFGMWKRARGDEANETVDEVLLTEGEA